LSRTIEFFAHGLPVAQGSKNPWGGESAKGLKPWRNDIRSAADAAMDGEGLILSPVLVRMTFVFPRPKSHYGTGKNAGVLKTRAPLHRASAPDLDKLIRAVGDALTGVVFRDDAQIVTVEAHKINGETPGVRVSLVALF
jgi:crossover junction endodeoxyribonuclease RusA